MQTESSQGVQAEAEPFSAVHQSSLKYIALLKTLHDSCLVKMLSETAGLDDPSQTFDDPNHARLLLATSMMEHDPNSPSKTN